MKIWVLVSSRPLARLYTACPEGCAHCSQMERFLPVSYALPHCDYIISYFYDFVNRNFRCVTSKNKEMA